MRRYFQILALLCAVGIIVVAFVEYDARNDDEVALPTTLPSPTDLTPTEAPTPTSTDEPTATVTDDATPQASAPRTQPGAAPTQAPTPSESQATATTAPATATPTVAPPRTPTPEPVGTAGPVTQAEGRTPRTGGSSAPAGVAIAMLALGLRAFLVRRRPSY